MRTSLKILLDGQWNTDQELRLWGIAPTGERIPTLELGLYLLSGDSASWYGTHAESWEEGPVGGVVLTGEALFDYLLAPAANPLITLEFSSYLQLLRDTALELRGAIQAKLLVPTIAARELRWKLAEACDHAQYPLLSEALQTNSAVAAWAATLMQRTLAHSPEKRAAIARLESWGEGGGMAPPIQELPEQELLHIIGWSRSTARYASGFRLDDPDPSPTGGQWSLTFMLTDHDRIVGIDCDPSGSPNSAPPTDWAYESGAAEERLDAWLRMVPFLEHPQLPGTLRVSLNDEEAWSFLTEISGMITELGGTVMLPAWWNRLRGRGAKLKAKLRHGLSREEAPMFGMQQMLQFDWKIAVGDIELSEQEFWAIAEEQKPLHFIRGEWIALDQALVDQIRKVMEKTKRKRGIPLRDALLRQYGTRKPDTSIEQWLSEDERLDWEIETSDAWLHFIDQLSHTDRIPLLPASPQFLGTLRGYQAEGLSWLVFMRQYGLGCILADDMGLGKTIQYIAYLLHVNTGAPSLLICPTSLVGNWQKELERFAPSLRILQHYGGSRTRSTEAFQSEVTAYDLVITTYMTALLDQDALRAVQWSSLCLDEAQHMKNAHTKQSVAIRRLTADHRIAMTGTPVENRLGELWSILDFTNPGYLGTHAAFDRQYGKLVEQERERSAASEQLRRLVRPFILRRMKSDARIAPDLPDKVESKIYIPLTKEQAALYENVLSGLLGGIRTQNGMDRRGAILAALTQLKQICDHPALFTKDHSAAAAAARHSHKSERLLEMVSELRAKGDRCLIFTQYVEMGTLLQRMLERSLKEPVLYLSGATPKAQRDRMVELFQGDAPPAQGQSRPGIFVLSLKAGGTGLNLTAANHVFHYDRWWNPAVENQATDRAYRIGQKQHVQVHKFITLGTVEERINEMIEKKQSLSRDIIDTDGSDNWITELSTDELHDLFALRRSWLDG